ncbi:hypothetical protein HT031_000056 [Scenedesmus sp. PABB004]|nr:hypothetical protein HT031_000056 [Scenedesmus sp. PABB004]
MAQLSGAASSEPGDGPSTSGRRVVIARHELPLELLLARREPAALGVVCGAGELRRVRRDAAWSQRREHLLAAAAAGFHLALFAWNLAFWGFEGVPPDRYWPENPRVKAGLVPGRYGNMAGAKKLWYYYLSKLEGGGAGPGAPKLSSALHDHGTAKAQRRRRRHGVRGGIEPAARIAAMPSGGGGSRGGSDDPMFSLKKRRKGNTYTAARRKLEASVERLQSALAANEERLHEARTREQALLDIVRGQELVLRAMGGDPAALPDGVPAAPAPPNAAGEAPPRTLSQGSLDSCPPAPQRGSSSEPGSEQSAPAEAPPPQPAPCASWPALGAAASDTYMGRLLSAATPAHTQRALAMDTRQHWLDYMRESISELRGLLGRALAEAAGSGPASARAGNAALAQLEARVEDMTRVTTLGLLHRAQACSAAVAVNQVTEQLEEPPQDHWRQVVRQLALTREQAQQLTAVKVHFDRLRQQTFSEMGQLAHSAACPSLLVIAAQAASSRPDSSGATAAASGGSGAAGSGSGAAGSGSSGASGGGMDWATGGGGSGGAASAAAAGGGGAWGAAAAAPPRRAGAPRAGGACARDDAAAAPPFAMAAEDRLQRVMLRQVQLGLYQKNYKGNVMTPLQLAVEAVVSWPYAPRPAPLLAAVAELLEEAGGGGAPGAGESVYLALLTAPDHRQQQAERTRVLTQQHTEWVTQQLADGMARGCSLGGAGGGTHA